MVRAERYLGFAVWLALSLACTPTARTRAVDPRAGAPTAESLPSSTHPLRAPCTDYRPPPPVPLEETVTFGHFVDALGRQIAELDPSALRPEYLELAVRRGWNPQTETLFDDYVRVRTLFEAVRDGGYWRLKWAITNREPSSTQIWRAWREQPLVEAFGHPSATAECDEISALFALLARRVGVRDVGLFYPTWNHTIAAWAPRQLRGTKSRLVLIPTTQIFLDCADSLDTTSFRTRLTSIGEYPRWDVRDSTPIPPSVARFLLEQVRIYGGASPQLQAILRARRANAFGSSVGACREYRAGLRQQLVSRLSCADRAALSHFASAELGQPSATTDQLLEQLAAP